MKVILFDIYVRSIENNNVCSYIAVLLVKNVIQDNVCILV